VLENHSAHESLRLICNQQCSVAVVVPHSGQSA
jgi:hypothetical protein